MGKPEDVRTFWLQYWRQIAYSSFLMSKFYRDQRLLAECQPKDTESFPYGSYMGGRDEWKEMP